MGFLTRAFENVIGRRETNQRERMSRVCGSNSVEEMPVSLCMEIAPRW